MDRHAVSAFVVPYTIDLDPNADLMCPMNSPPNVYYNFHLTNRQLAWLLHTVSDYQETKKTEEYIQFDYCCHFKMCIELYLAAIVKCAQISCIHFSIIGSSIRKITR